MITPATGLDSVTDRDRGAGWVFVPVAFAAALVALIWLRFGGRWTENDTAVLAQAARGVLAQGTITPDGVVYDHGFAYPTLLATMSGVTGLPIAFLQMTVLPWFTLVTTLAAFIAFRAITGSGRAGAVGALLLLVQSDFLFVSQRGSHEKVTWTLVLTVLWALMTSFRARRVAEAAPVIAVFYVCGFALLCTNAFFGSSLTTVIFFAAAGSAVVGRRLLRFDNARRLAPRLGYAFATLGLMTYLVMAVLYPPARSTIGSSARAADRIASLYLNVETGVESQVSATTNARSSAIVSTSRTTSSPYRTISLGWTSTQVFFALTSFTWLLILTGAFCWLVLGVSFLRRRVAQPEVAVFLVWALAAAAAVQVGMSLVSDFAGVLGSNLQLRLFPFFAVFTVPVVVAAAFRHQLPRRSKLLRWVTIGAGVVGVPALAVASPFLTVMIGPLALVALVIHLAWQRSVWARRAAVAIGTAAYMLFALAAFLKAMNDPLVSTKWTFYTPAEERALAWGNAALTNQLVWSDYDERLQVASIMLTAGPVAGEPSAVWTRGQSFAGRYVMLSDTTAARAARLRAIVPTADGLDRIYDNGRVRFGHRVPVTPYQP